MRSLPVLALTALLLVGCGEKNSYDAAEGALRDWLAAHDADSGLPDPGAAMEVSVWDPSGEAQVDVTDSDGEVRTFWMVFEDGSWRVDGEAP